MASPGTGCLFGEVPIREFRREVFQEIEAMATGLDRESPQYIPEAMFVHGVIVRFDFDLPRLYFDRTHARLIDYDGTRYREVHVPMVGKPVNLHLAPRVRNESNLEPATRQHDVVDGDLCVYVELNDVPAATLEAATWALLEEIRRDYERLRTDLRALREEALATARQLYRQRTGTRPW